MIYMLYVSQFLNQLKKGNTMGGLITLSGGAIIAMTLCDTSNICSDDQKFLANIFGVIGITIIGCTCASIGKKNTNKEKEPLLDHTQDQDPAVATKPGVVQP